LLCIFQLRVAAFCSYLEFEMFIKHFKLILSTQVFIKILPKLGMSKIATLEI